MATKNIFPGFPEQTLRFYRGIARYNNRAWFADHKQDYQDFVLQPAHDFVLALGAKLLDACYAQCKVMLRLNEWLVELKQSVY